MTEGLRHPEYLSKLPLTLLISTAYSVIGLPFSSGYPQLILTAQLLTVIDILGTLPGGELIVNYSEFEKPDSPHWETALIL